MPPHRRSGPARCAPSPRPSPPWRARSGRGLDLGRGSGLRHLVDLLPADRARLARREGPPGVRAPSPRGWRTSTRLAPTRPPSRPPRAPRRARASASAAASAASILVASAARASVSSACRAIRHRLRRRGVRDVAFVGLHQVRERPELLAVSVEGCDSRELGVAGRARLVRRAKDVLRRGDPRAGVARGSGRGLDVGFVRKRAGDLGERRPCGRSPRRRLPQRHPAPSPGARSRGRPIPAPAAVRAIDPPPFAPRRAARAPRRSVRAPCRGR